VSQWPLVTTISEYLHHCLRVVDEKLIENADMHGELVICPVYEDEEKDEDLLHPANYAKNISYLEIAAL
jgi:hypothetical protein